MATIRRFEDIEAWQKARELTRAVYALSAEGRFAKDFALRDQMRRAAISIMSNIAEGFERSGSAEFGQFLAVAKGSTGEVEAQLYVALDQTYVSQEQFDRLSELCQSTKRLIAGFMKYLKTSNLRGTKFK
ncbi:MAG: four helix bundle protein [Deltaproteobacteria bacterium]|nr:four helix bundle protein [Deltaproteobacteria bacterium]MBI3388388.1 four helix bundle protein [Deltaproteobacteria bacterium]